MNFSVYSVHAAEVYITYTYIHLITYYATYVQDTSDGGEASELGLDNVGGVFVVLVAGVSCACFITMFELLWDIYSREDKVQFLIFICFFLPLYLVHGATLTIKKIQQEYMLDILISNMHVTAPECKLKSLESVKIIFEVITIFVCV